MNMLEQLREQLRTRLDARSAADEALTAIISAAEQRGDGSMTADETTAFDERRAEIAAIDADVAGLNQRISDIEDIEARRQQADAVRATLPADPQSTTSPTRVTSEPEVYRRGGNHSFFADSVAAFLGRDPGANERLQRHARVIETDAERRVAQGQVEFRDLTRTDGAGGYLVPPLWLMDDFIALARAGRVTADLVNRRPLPPGTDSINIPAVSTGTATAIQTADNAAVQETDLADATITAPVRTIAGQQDVAIQLIEQSPLPVDDIIFADLAAAYATNVGTQVLSGSGTSGQITGLRTVSGIIAVTYTDASPTVGEAYPKIADAIQQMHANRYMPPTAIIMHPRRWGWFLSALDTSNRPLVVPNSSGPFNAMGNADAPNSEGPVGTLMGVPVYVDPNIPTNLGAGTNEDVILVIRGSDSWLWESPLRTRVLPDVGSGTLTVRLQVYGYVAFTGARYPKSTATVGGTGLIAPTF